MTGSTLNEVPKERFLFIELAAASLVRSAEVAAIALIAVLVCPPLLIVLVAVAVPLVAPAALVAMHRLQRLQPAKGSR